MQRQTASDTSEQFVIISKVKLANDQCFEDFMREFLAFFIKKECIKNIHKLTSLQVMLSYLSKEMLRNFITHFIYVFQMHKTLLTEV